MNFKLILIACTASLLMLSGCEKAKETAQASKETAAKVVEKTESAVTGKADEIIKGATEQMGEVTQETFDAALSTAKELADKAADKGAQWRDTSKLLKTAEKAASEGDLAKAMELANTAKIQADAALQQYESMQNAGPRF